MNINIFTAPMLLASHNRITSDDFIRIDTSGKFGLSQFVASKDTPLIIRWGDGESTIATSESPTDYVHNCEAGTYISFRYPSGFRYQNNKNLFLTDLSYKASEYAKFSVVKPLPYIPRYHELAYIFGDPNSAEPTSRHTSFVQSVCEDVFRYYTSATTAGVAFGSAKFLKEIPEGIFRYTPNIKTFQLAFIHCTELATVPAYTFYHNKKCINFSKCFNECPNIPSGTKVYYRDPDALIDHNMNVTMTYINE